MRALASCAGTLVFHRYFGCRTLGKGLQFFSGLEADSLAWGNIYFRSGARIAADSGLARSDVENAEAAQFDTIALFERFLHAVEYGLDRHLRLRFRDAG